MAPEHESKTISQYDCSCCLNFLSNQNEKREGHRRQNPLPARLGLNATDLPEFQEAVAKYKDPF